MRPALNYLYTTSVTGVMSAYAVLRQIPRHDPALFKRHTRLWADAVAKGIGVDIELHGGERLRPDGTYVLMANHQSQVDIVALMSALPMVPGFLAKAELRRVPLFGRAMEAGGHVFVERGVHQKAVEAIDRAAEDIRNGGSIVIFPEGTRSRRREVLPFKKGGFHLAKKARVPIVPIGLRGTAEVLPKHEKGLVPGTVEVHVGEPIAPEVVEATELAQLIEDVRGQICELAKLPAALDRSGA